MESINPKIENVFISTIFRPSLSFACSASPQHPAAIGPQVSEHSMGAKQLRFTEEQEGQRLPFFNVSVMSHEPVFSLLVFGVGRVGRF